MRSTRGLRFVALVLGLQLAACSDEETAGPSGGGGQGGDGGSPEPSVQLRVFHTSDEKGWIVADTERDPAVVRGGAAAVYAAMTDADGYVRGRDFLVSSGDTWSGARVSSWFHGAPTMEVFGAMGYSASALGEHDLDAGPGRLTRLAERGGFHYLAANVLETPTGEPPPWVTPMSIQRVRGVDVALIGIVGPSMATAMPPQYAQRVEVAPPGETLETTARLARWYGAEVVIVLYHGCNAKALLRGVTQRIDLVLAGHCGRVRHETIRGVPFVESGEDLAGYTRIDLTYEPRNGDVSVDRIAYREVSHPARSAPEREPDRRIADLVARWVERAEKELGVGVGYTTAGIPDDAWTMANWVTDAWLTAYPAADVAILDFGSMRTSIDRGRITVGDVFDALPREDRIVETEISGYALAALIQALLDDCAPGKNCYPAVAGMRYVRGSSPLVVEIAGKPLDGAATYRVLTTDYVYYGGGSHPGLASIDPAPRATGVSYRDPVIDWTRRLQTSRKDPLEAHVDPAPRDR